MKKKKQLITIIIFLLVLTFLFPYSGDDWAWGSKIGLERLFNGFRNYNGRYVGNLIVILLTRSRILRTFVMTGTFFGIFWLSFKIVNKKNPSLLLIAFTLFLATPISIFRQAVVWTSGFTNYALSTLLVLVFLYLNQEKKLFKRPFLVLILGLISSLFVENITLFLLVLSFILLVYSYIKERKVSKFYLFYFLGTLIGATIMFLNGAYQRVLSETDGYRTIAKGLMGIFLRMKENYFEVIYSNLIFNNFFLNLIMTFLLLFLVFKYLNNNNNKSEDKKQIVLMASFIHLSYLIYTFLTIINPTWEIMLRYTIYFEGLLTILYFISIIVIVLITVLDKEIKKKLLFYLLIITLMVDPLFVVTPIGGRCFFSTYIIFIIFVLELINYVISDKTFAYIFTLSLFVSIAIGSYLLNVYLYLYFVDYQRFNYIKKMNKIETEIIVPKLPYRGYTWMSDPISKYKLDKKYKLFYNIDKDMEIKCLDYDQWLMERDDS